MKIFIALIMLSVFTFNLTLAQRSIQQEVELLLINESYTEALAFVREGIASDSTNAGIWYLGGIAHGKLARYDSSLVYYQNAVMLEPGNERMNNALASLYSGMSRFTSAIEIYTGMIERDTTNNANYINLASIYLRNRQPRQALTLYEELHRREPGNYNFMKSTAVCYRQLGNDPEAVSWYRKAHELYNEDLSINLELAQLYMKMRNFREGLEISERGLEIDRNHQQLLYWSGVFNYAVRFYHQAIVRLSHSENSGNESPAVKQYLGICYFHIKKYDQARDYLEKAVSKIVNDHRLYNYLGVIHRMNGDYDASERYFFTSLSILEPPAAALTETFLNLVDTYRQNGNNDKAAWAYRSAMHYDPENPDLYYGLAYIYDNYLGQIEDALENYLIFSELAEKLNEKTGDLPALLDHSNARIRRIKEDLFFDN